ncbi:hypothetical protein KKE33_01500 [Patescibacteria group bacterium]|nr:hypothetical protein [Patescibacteria group bacterium]
MAKNKKLDAQLSFWESRFPGRGEALMDILQPFYDWEPKLKPALPDLEEQAKKVIFWKEISGVRVFTGREFDSLKASLKDSLRTSLKASLWDSLKASLWDSLEDSLRTSLWDSLRASLWSSLWDSLRASLRVSLWSSLRDSLFYSCGFILADKLEEAAKFQPLLDLWFAGNFPVGFDKDGNLLVLVANPK